MIIFPWLTRLGYLPYRDFFDHHGFLLYYLLAPFTYDKSLFQLKLFYFVIQMLNLYLVLMILKKSCKFFGLVVGGLLFVFINYYFSENTLWYETLLTTFFLITHILLIMKHVPYKTVLLGTIVAFASFVKPNATVLLFPILVITKNFKTTVVFILFWAIVLLYFSFNNGLSALLSNLFSFNSYLLKHYTAVNFFSRKDTTIIVIALFTSLYCYLISTKKQREHIRLLLLMVITSLIFLGADKSRLHLYPASAFFPILSAVAIEKAKKYQRYFITFFLCTILAIIGREIGRYYFLYRQEFLPWTETVISKQVTNGIQIINRGKEPIFILGDNTEAYFFNDLIPPSYFAIKLPLVEDFFPEYQEKVITDLQEEEVSYIVIPKPEKEEYKKLVTLHTFIKTQYRLLLDQPYYTIYKKK